MFARELPKRPRKPGERLPRETISSLPRCSSSRPRLPRSSMMSLKPPVVPRPPIGGAPTAETIAPWTSRWQRSRRAAAIASALRSGLRRLPNSSSKTYIAPGLGALAFRISDWPAIVTVWATPRVSRASLSTCAITRCVRSAAAGVGQLDIEEQVPLVRLRDEADGGKREFEVRHGEEPGIDYECEHASAEQAPRHLGTGRDLFPD